MQEKPYPFGGKFLKTSFFILLLPQIQKNAVSLWQKKQASGLSIYGALTLSLPLTLEKASELSFYSLNRGIDFVDTPDVRKKTQAFFSLTEPGH